MLADPTELMLTLSASHMVTPTLLLDVNPTGWTARSQQIGICFVLKIAQLKMEVLKQVEQRLYKREILLSAPAVTAALTLVGLKATCLLSKSIVVTIPVPTLNYISRLTAVVL